MTILDDSNESAAPPLHKQHFACFACRKAYKQVGSEGIGVEAERPFPCPECRQPMTLMGRDFQAPPVRAGKQWQALEVLRSFGVVFEPGHKHPPLPPRTLREVEQFLEREGYDPEVVRQRGTQLRAARPAKPRPKRVKPQARQTRRRGR